MICIQNILHISLPLCFMVGIMAVTALSQGHNVVAVLCEDDSCSNVLAKLSEVANWQFSFLCDLFVEYKWSIDEASCIICSFFYRGCWNWVSCYNKGTQIWDLGLNLSPLVVTKVSNLSPWLKQGLKFEFLVWNKGLKFESLGCMRSQIWLPWLKQFLKFDFLGWNKISNLSPLIETKSQIWIPWLNKVSNLTPLLKFGIFGVWDVVLKHWLPFWVLGSPAG